MKKPIYMNFAFLRLDPAYHRLMKNEKVVAKQEFLASYDTYQAKIPTAAYALTGVRADCDIMFWRIAPRIDDFNSMSCRLQESGVGKYLTPARSLLGTVAGQDYVPPAVLKGSKKGETPKILGKSPYLFVRPVIGGDPGALPRTVGLPTARLHVADCSGLDDHDYILAFETQEPTEYRTFMAKWADAPTAQCPTYVCLLREIRDIVDSLG